MTQTSTPWPGNCQGAVSLTFDDGAPSQLATAVPILNKFSLQGSFYINPRDGYEQTLAPWKEVAAAGHEIGNHTVNHPCSKNFASVPALGRNYLEDMTMDDIEGEILEAARRLKAIVPQQKEMSFAYPCYQPFIGRGATRQSYVPLIARHCIAGRGRGEQSNNPLHCDLAYLWSFPCERMTGAEMVGLAEHVVGQNRWSILTFHGIHAGHLSVSDGDLTELCAFLARHRDRIWTAPVATIARRIVEWRKTV